MAELPKVRIATPEDEVDIMALCRGLHKENGMFSLNERKVLDLIRKCWMRQGVIVGVIGERGHLEASTCLVLDGYYYTDEWHLSELWNYVDPGRRKGSHNAEALIEFGKKCAEKMGCPLITGIVTNTKTAGKVRFYRRLLGYPAGAFFIHNAKWRSEPMVDHSELRRKLGEFSQLCNDRKVTFEFARLKIGPLLREAAEAIGSEDSLWGTAKKPSNGAATAP